MAELSSLRAAVEDLARVERIITETVTMLELPTDGEGILRLIAYPDRVHETARVCPVCTMDLAHTALVSIAYTFETCSCPEWSYAHLIPQLWHRNCFLTLQEED